jgi:probable F420-dependent oxidoreductase
VRERRRTDRSGEGRATEGASHRPQGCHHLSVRLAISIPQFLADGTFDPAGFRAYLARAEALGFSSAWTQEQVLGSHPQLSPIETMAYAAACTERIRLGCAVLVTTLHNPIHLAKRLSTLDQLTRGRVEVGVALGGRSEILPAFGVDPATRVARFTEGLRLMKALWTEPRVTFEGRFWRLENADVEPKPFQKPHPRVWFGASHPAALRRAVTYGDGFFGAGSSSTEQFAGQVQTLRDLLREAGRNPAAFPIAKRVYIAVDDDVERARERVGSAFEGIYGRSGLEHLAIYGPPDHCVRALHEVGEAGAELILFTTLFDEREQMESLASEVVPHLSQRR